MCSEQVIEIKGFAGIGGTHELKEYRKIQLRILTILSSLENASELKIFGFVRGAGDGN